MDEMLTFYVRLTAELREALQGRRGLLTPLREDEAIVFGQAVEAMPGLVANLRAELPEANPKVVEILDVMATLSAMIRDTLRSCPRSWCKRPRARSHRRSAVRGRW